MSKSYICNANFEIDKPNFFRKETLQSKYTDALSGIYARGLLHKLDYWKENFQETSKNVVRFLKQVVYGASENFIQLRWHH